MQFSHMVMLAEDGSLLIYHNFLSAVKETELIGELQNTILKLEPSSQPSFDCQKNLRCFFLTRNGIHFCLISKRASAPQLYVVHVLKSFMDVLKDFCHGFDEKSVRNNVILIYEIIQQFFDDGFVQVTDNAKLKQLIVSRARPQRLINNTSPGLFGTVVENKSIVQNINEIDSFSLKSQMPLRQSNKPSSEKSNTESSTRATKLTIVTSSRENRSSRTQTRVEPFSKFGIADPISNPTFADPISNPTFADPVSNPTFNNPTCLSKDNKIMGSTNNNDDLLSHSGTGYFPSHSGIEYFPSRSDVDVVDDSRRISNWDLELERGERAAKEIYLDLIEKMNVTINEDGSIKIFDVIGQLIIQSKLLPNTTLEIYLSKNVYFSFEDNLAALEAGRVKPDLTGLNERFDGIKLDLTRLNERFDGIKLDLTGLNEQFNRDLFLKKNCISYHPLLDQEVLLNYKMSSRSSKVASGLPPFFLDKQIEPISKSNGEMVLKLKLTCDLGNTKCRIASMLVTICLKCQIVKIEQMSFDGITNHRLMNSSNGVIDLDLSKEGQKIIWKLKNIPSKSLNTISIKLSLSNNSANSIRVDPISIYKPTNNRTENEIDWFPIGRSIIELPINSRNSQSSLLIGSSSLETDLYNIDREKLISSFIGRINLDFEISDHSASGLRIEAIRLVNERGQSTEPIKWLRYITTTDSYTFLN